MAEFDDIDEGEDDGDESKSKPQIELPEDFDTEEEFLEHMREEFRKDLEADEDNRTAATEDLEFVVGDQWEPVVRQSREAARKPTLTINRLPAFVAQIIGNRRLNETQIKVVPDVSGTKAVAQVREDLMRNIQKASHADLAYDNSLANCVLCGIGNFQVELDYEGDDVFEQTMLVDMLPDALAVVWDRRLIDPSGRDAGHVFVVDSMAKEDFDEEYPWATPSDITSNTSYRPASANLADWFAEDQVRIVNYWRMRTKKRILALMADSSTQDITDELKDPEKKNQVLAGIQQRDDGTPIMRKVNRKYAQMYTCTGSDILEGPYNLEISRVPVFRVPGWEVFIGEQRHRWGIVRHAKDPQRLHNFWRSVIAEKIMQSPRGVWKASDAAIAGREEEWRNSHLSDDPLLVWNAEAGTAPERVEPVQMEPNLIAQAEISSQDIKDVTNIHEANLGMPSNEVSGRAILARQRVSDTGTVIYHDNLNYAIEEAGRVMDELIPTVYDTKRIVKVLGQDSVARMQAINDVADETSVNINSGKYGVTVITGPSYQTKRMEAADGMMNFINAMPQEASLAADLIVEAQDWPGADKIAARLRMLLPPGMVDPRDMSPQELQQYASQAQGNAQKANLAYAEAVAKLDNLRADTAQKVAQAQNYQSQVALAPGKQQIDALNTASQAADRELRGHLEAIHTAEGG